MNKNTNDISGKELEEEGICSECEQMYEDCICGEL